MVVDHYLSISQFSFTTCKEKGSKFLTFSHSLCQKTEVKLLVDKYGKDYSEAPHVCHDTRMVLSTRCSKVLIRASQAEQLDS